MQSMGLQRVRHDSAISCHAIGQKKHHKHTDSKCKVIDSHRDMRNIN